MNNKKIPQFIPKNQKNKKLKFNLFLLGITLTCFISIIAVFGFSFNSKLGLVKHNITISNLNKNIDGFTILHISDLNGDDTAINSDEFIKLFKGVNFDAVCLTGNMIGKSNNLKPLFKLIHLIKSLNSSSPIYFITGASDPDPVTCIPQGNTEVLSEYIKELRKLDVIYLDRPYQHRVNTNSIWFCPEYVYSIDPKSTLNAMTNEIKRIEEEGLQYEANGAAIYRSLSYKSRAMEDSIEASKTISDNDIEIVLSNTPISSEYVSYSIRNNDPHNLFSINKAHLILSGYFQGGQWNLPNGTPIYVPDYGFFPEKEKVYGLSRILTLVQYISPGLSCSDIYPYPPFRLFNQPSVALLKLTNKYK